MKNIKRIVAGTMAVPTLSAVGTAALAANPIITDTKDVKGTVAESAESYSVAVAWGALTYQYSFGTWDPSSKTYANGSWLPTDGDNDKITVKQFKYCNECVS